MYILYRRSRQPINQPTGVQIAPRSEHRRYRIPGQCLLRSGNLQTTATRKAENLESFHSCLSIWQRQSRRADCGRGPIQLPPIHTEIISDQNRRRRNTMFPLRSLSLFRALPIFSRGASSQSSPLSQRFFSPFTRIPSGNSLRDLRFAQQSNNGEVAAAVRSLEQVRGMKTRSSVKRLCDGCKVCWFFFLIWWIILGGGEVLFAWIAGIRC